MNVYYLVSSIVHQNKSHHSIDSILNHTHNKIRKELDHLKRIIENEFISCCVHSMFSSQRNTIETERYDFLIKQSNERITNDGAHGSWSSKLNKVS